MEKKSTSDVVNMLGCHRSTVKNWARKNGVEAVHGAKGEILSYLWTDADIAQLYAIGPKI
jgi:uncharacterized protein YjcR